MSTPLAPPPAAPPDVPVAPATPPTAAPPALKSIVLADQGVTVPGWVKDLDSFRRWTLADDFPSRGRIEFLDGDVWVDTTMEEFFGHNQVKAKISFVLAGIIEAGNLGRYIPDQMRLVNTAAGLA